MKNYKYRLCYFKEYILLYKIFNIKDIKDNFINKYGDLEYDISEEEKENIIKNYKIKKNLKEDTDINFNKIINIDNQIKTSIQYSNSFINIKKNNHQLIMDIKYNNENIISNIKVSFKRKNIEFIKDIYIIMNKQMKLNIVNENVTQHFIDCTYRCIKPNNKGMKLLILLGFDNENKKTILIMMSLIKNKNYETINEILVYLKSKYNFRPKLITLDMARGPIKAFIRNFTNIDIYICFYHFISRVVLHLPQLKSKKPLVKKKEQNI